MAWTWVALGGALGSVARYGITLLMRVVAIDSVFALPWATLAVNVLGSFAIGRVMHTYAAGAISEPHKLFLTTGVLGGFTTFSAFSFETFSLITSQRLLIASVYVALSCVLGLSACAMGYFGLSGLLGR